MSYIPIENHIVDILKGKGGPMSSEELARQLRSLNIQVSLSDLRRILMKMELMGVIRVYSRKEILVVELVTGGEDGG